MAVVLLVEALLLSFVTLALGIRIIMLTRRIRCDQDNGYLESLPIG